tara:strand:- start:182 stop:613 length:432 start_codon:yes stop_codon:yes gene_type:complete
MNATIRLKTLKKRFKALKEPSNNFTVIETLDDIRVKVSILLTQHEKYEEIKRKRINNPFLPDLLDGLVYDYKTILDSMMVYSDQPELKTLKKSLVSNLKVLQKEQSVIYKKLTNANVPSMIELNSRFSELTKYAKLIASKKKK